VTSRTESCGIVESTFDLFVRHDVVWSRLLEKKERNEGLGELVC